MTPHASDESLVHLRTRSGDCATVSLHGAQVLSWVSGEAGEQLYVSPQSQPAAGRSARGGVPVCFPQFADRGPLPKHGFVRNSRWELVAGPAPHAAVAEARFQVDSSTATLRWEHAFCLVLVVRLGPGWLEMHLQVANTGDTAYAFTTALHTYLALQDVRSARLHGLQGRIYQDNLAGLQERQEASEALAFDGEIDRVYLQVPPVLRLLGGGAARRIVQKGFRDVVVWNPGPDKAARLGDMPPADWQRMLCIEAGAIGQPVSIAPGKTWHGLQRLELPERAGFDLAQAAPVPLA